MSEPLTHTEPSPLKSAVVEAAAEHVWKQAYRYMGCAEGKSFKGCALLLDALHPFSRIAVIDDRLVGPDPDEMHNAVRHLNEALTKIAALGDQA